MRTFIATVFAGFMLCAGGANASGWKADNEGVSPAAKGCSLGSDFEFLCLEVGCSASKSRTLHGWLTGEILEGDFSLRIDGKLYPVRGGKHTLENAASKTELSGDLDSIVAAMKSGTTLFIDYPAILLDDDFATIPLRGSTRAIGTVEAACVPAGAIQASEGALLRDKSGKVSIGNLNSSKDCAFAKGTGVVKAVERGGPSGTIDGMTFVDDKY